MSDQSDFTAAVGAALAEGPLLLELTAEQAVSLVAIIQLACRHPGLQGSAGKQTAEAMARVLQDELGRRRSADLGRLLERGWHSSFDVERKPT